MRILRLDLDAFGPFTDVSLALDGPEDALQVVYGPNEAGKSTALRALVGLLFGIDERTRDAHVHPPARMRVGALLEAAGERLACVRHKRRKNSLTTPDGEPLDEARLAALLRGVGRERFLAMFGLDHERLRAGAEALLRGQGAVGESLFDAGAGSGRAIHDVLLGLESEANALFTPRGRKLPLNAAIERYKQRRRDIRTHEVSAAAWRQQNESIERLRSDLEALQQRRRALASEKARLERDLRIAPLAARLRAAAKRRAEFGVLPALPDHASERRQASFRSLENADAGLVRLAAECARLEEQRDGLVVPDALVRIPDATIDALHEDLARHRDAMREVAELEAQRAQTAAAVRAALARLGRDPDRAAIDDLRVTARAETRIRALLRERTGIESAVRQAREAIARLVARRRLREEHRAALAPRGDLAPLERAIDAARELGDAERRTAEASAALAERRRAAEEALARLQPSPGDLEALRVRAWPPAELLDACVDERDALLAERHDLGRREAELRRRRDDLVRRLDAEQEAGDVPTEARLEAARAARDLEWQRLAAAPRIEPDAAEAFERTLRAADAIADRLRREAQRVMQVATLRADLRAVDRALAALEAERQELADRETAHAERWAALWSESGVVPDGPREMRAWRLAVQDLVREATALAAESAAVERLAHAVRERRAELRTALSAAGEAPDPEPDLAALLAHAVAVAEAARDRAARRAALDAELEELEEQRAEQAAALAEAEVAFDAWRERWAGAVPALQLEPDATAEEAETMLTELRELFRHVDALHAAEARLAAIAREAEAFARGVTELAAALPGGAPENTEEAAAALIAQHRAARTTEATRAALDREIEARRAAMRDLEAARSAAREDLAELLRSAGVDSPAELEALEQRIAEARALEVTVRDLEAQILAAGEGADLAAVLDDVRGFDAAAAEARREEVRAELDGIEKDRDRLQHDLGSQKAGLRLFGDRSAAEPAAEAEEALAEVCEHARRYAQLRLAAVLLRREIERYREANQGPILARTNALFPRLTLGRYTAVRAGWSSNGDDVLECVRADGSTATVDALSDGTRDQLFLALRIASIELETERDGPLPFVADDVLIHFDDDRARAALVVLAELARTTQVLFFTHHARILELGREALGDRLQALELPAAAPAR